MKKATGVVAEALSMVIVTVPDTDTPPIVALTSAVIEPV